MQASEKKCKVELKCKADPTKRPAVRWSVQMEDADPLLPLDGPSHGLATCVGMRVLRDKLMYDKDCIFSARMEGNRIRTVSALRTKLMGIASRGDLFLWFGIAPDTTDFSEEELRDRRDSRVRIKKIETIDQAVELATRTDTGIRQFLQAVKDYPDHGTDLDDQQKRFDKRPHYMPHHPSQLYVVPDVIIRPLADVLEQQSWSAKEKRADGDQPKTLRSLTAQDRDVNEEVNSDQGTVEQRNWADVCDSVERTPRQRGVLLGPAGQGKSLGPLPKCG